MSFLETSKSLLNNSPSKQLYSFSRASRFQKMQIPQYDLDDSAAINLHMMVKSTSFGYGMKMTFENKQKVPAPVTYEKGGIFQLNQTKRRGYSFSLDKKRGLINEEDALKLPGPGQYNYRPDKAHFKQISYTLRSKHQDPLAKHQNPLGPGHYATLTTINQDGKHYIAKYQSSGASKIGNAKRFANYSTISPGPGNYEDTKTTAMNASGYYFYSGLRSQKANRFSQAERIGIQKSIAPGPGAYARFSQFPRMG